MRLIAASKYVIYFLVLRWKHLMKACRRLSVRRTTLLTIVRVDCLSSIVPRHRVSLVLCPYASGLMVFSATAKASAITAAPVDRGPMTFVYPQAKTDMEKKEEREKTMACYVVAIWWRLEVCSCEWQCHCYLYYIEVCDCESGVYSKYNTSGSGMFIIRWETEG